MIAELVGENVSVNVDRFGLVELNAEDEQVLLTASDKIQDQLGFVELAHSSSTIVLGEKDQVLMMKLGV